MTEPVRPPGDVRLVSLTPDDVDAVCQIFNEHVAGGFAAYPEAPVSTDFVAELLRSAAGYPAYAAKGEDGALLGFGFLRPYAPIPAFAGTAVSTIFLAVGETGRGIGSALLQRTLDAASSRGITRVLAHVSSKNPRSIAFHRNLGFVECGRFPDVGCKWGERFDVVWMVKRLET